MPTYMNQDRIKCGKCKSEYFPRSAVSVSFEPLDKASHPVNSGIDYSCPVCGHGKFNEDYKITNSQILKD